MEVDRKRLPLSLIVASTKANNLFQNWKQRPHALFGPALPFLCYYTCYRIAAIAMKKIHSKKQRSSKIRLRKVNLRSQKMNLRAHETLENNFPPFFFVFRKQNITYEIIFFFSSFQLILIIRYYCSGNLKVLNIFF